MYESTLTLQRISSLLTDGEKQSKDEEGESRPPSSVGVLPDCCELVVTPDGATDPPSLSNLNDDVVVELLLSAEGEIYPGFYVHTFHIKHENMTIHTSTLLPGGEDVFSREDFLSVDVVSGTSMNETFRLNKRSEVISLHTMVIEHLMLAKSN